MFSGVGIFTRYVDLGYWDFNLLWEIQDIGGFFLSRIKSKAVIYITEMVQGKIAQKYIGSSLLSVPVKRKRSNILEVMIEKMCDKGTLCCRLVFGTLLKNVIIGI